MQKLCLIFMIGVLVSSPLFGAGPETHTDESRVPEYTLPDPLKFTDGHPVTTPEQWTEQRRPELLKLFEEQVYGKAPAAPDNVKFQILSQEDNALDGRAIRKEIEITLADQPHPVTMTMLLYLPKTGQPAPVFWGLNFFGNQAVTIDPAIRINQNWIRENPPAVVDHKATEASRGLNARRWPIQQIIDRGYAVATAYYGDIDPDFDDDFQNGIQPAFYRSGQTKPDPDEWGSIAAWAWGLSRGLDYLQQDPDVDGSRVAVLGHSRLGKTALWAGARDPRFALTISNDSGCGGAALSRRGYGETIERINTSFPHWFCKNFKQYNKNEAALPVDQHELVALVAPRPVYIASASEDQWADPKGEFLAARFADPVYRLLGTTGMGGDAPPESPPPADQPIQQGVIGYHMREGKHDILEYDWNLYMDFADQHMQKTPQ